MRDAANPLGPRIPGKGRGGRQPVQSVSELHRVGADVRLHDYTCNQCDLDACIYRDTWKRRAGGAELA